MSTVPPEQHEWIQQLLDGELDAVHEQPLFSDLAVNTDLRAELKQQLAIRSTVQNDRMALLPPAHLTNAVFSGLGFAAPLAGAVAGAAGGGIIASLLSALAATAITWFAVTSDGQTPAHPTAVAGNAPVTTTPVTGQQTMPTDDGRLQELERTNAGLARTNGDLQRMLEARRRETSALRREMAALERQHTPAVQQPVSTTDDGNGTTMNQEVTTPMASMVTVTNSMALVRDTEPKTFAMTKLDVMPSAWEKYPAFMIQARGIASAPLTQTTVSAQTAWYQNIGLAMLYQLSDNHGIGLEFGSETFPQVFEGSRASGQIIRYEQQPASMWAGIFYRYRMAQPGGSVAPFGQILAGGTKFGPLGRATVGLEYTPVGPLSFLVGVEGTMMGYQFQNKWFSSSKLGLTYGVAVRF